MTTADLTRYTAPERAATESRCTAASPSTAWGRPRAADPPSARCSTSSAATTPPAVSREQILHRYLEASRYTFADRNAYLADPAFFDVPVEGLLSTSFADERRALITE